MITLDIDQSFAPESERLDQALLHSVEEQLNKRLLEVPEGSVSVRYVSDQEIQRLNRMYREKDEVTDVLSFSNVHELTSGHLGDVVVATNQAKRQAVEGDVELELLDLVVHGILHVLGFDHEEPADAKEMFSLQDEIVQSVL